MSELDGPQDETKRVAGGISKTTTPLRRASSVGPPSSRDFRRTPSAQPRTPAGISRYGGGSARKPLVVTPHGRAAQRQLELRRTPGKDRRRSGRQQRETPRDALRALSRILASKSQPIAPTPTGSDPATNKRALKDVDDLDDEPDLQRPRLSLPIGEEDEDDDSLLLPPRSAGLEDENFTVQSVELGRRARSEQPLSRLSRGSFGSIGMSDNFGDFSAFRMDGDVDDSSFMGRSLVQDGYDMSNILEEIPGDDTQTLRDLGLGRAALTRGRDSDIRPLGLAEEGTDNNFLFTIPPRDATDDLTNGLLPDDYISPLQRNDLNTDPENLMDLRETNDADSGEEESEDEEEMEGANQSIGVLGNDFTHALDMDLATQEATSEVVGMAKLGTSSKMRKMKAKVSVHGIQYPSLPAGVVKKLATTFARTTGNSKTKINKETLDEIIQASDWFFEQVSDDLGAYAQHGGRKTIDESDVVMLMARQRQTNPSTTPFSLAQKFLPRELLQEMRMVPAPVVKEKKRRKSDET